MMVSDIEIHFAHISVLNVTLKYIVVTQKLFDTTSLGCTYAIHNVTLAYHISNISSRTTQSERWKEVTTFEQYQQR